MLTHLELSQFLLLLGAQRADVQFAQMSVSGHSSCFTFRVTLFQAVIWKLRWRWWSSDTVTCCCQLSSFPAADKFLVDAFTRRYGKWSKDGSWLNIFIATFCVETSSFSSLQSQLSKIKAWFTVIGNIHSFATPKKMAFKLRFCAYSLKEMSLLSLFVMSLFKVAWGLWSGFKDV